MRRLMWFSIGFAGACLLSAYLLPELWRPWACLIAAALALAACLWGKAGVPRAARSAGTEAPGKRMLRLLTWGLALGLLWCWGCEALILAPVREGPESGEALEAQLCDYPVETYYGYRADAYVERSGRQIRTRFYLYGELPALEPGDWITGDFTLRRADRSTDGEQWLELQAQGIQLTASGRVTASARGKASLRWFPARLSGRIYDRLGELIPADAAGLPQAMLTGKRSGLTEELRQALSDAGASHIVAVSGLHVAMLMGVLTLLLGRSRLATLLGLGVLALFVLMTGASPSVIRAAVMLALLLAAPLFGEESDPPSSLALAGLLILLANPWTVANLSFQLSFAAVAGLLLVSKPLLDYLLALPRIKKLLEWSGLKGWSRRPRAFLIRSLRGLVRFLCASLSASLGALIFSMPIAALSFGSMPVYGVLTNLAVIPLATLCLSGALLTLVLGLVSTTLGAWAGWLLAWPVRAILGICKGVSRLPGSRLYLDAFGAAFLVFAGLSLLLVLLLREKRYGWPLLSALAVLAGMVLFQNLASASAVFTMAALDVGQGQCVCLVTEDFAAVTDCGGSGGPAAGTTAADWLRRKGAERLDALILTHYDTDHVSGAATLLRLMPVDRLYLPDVAFDPENRAMVEEAARRAGTEVCCLQTDLVLPFARGQVTLFAPVSDRNDNAACVSVLYSVEEYDMLITGDLDTRGEYALLEQKALPRVEAYVAGHHGSAGSSSEALLEALKPDTVFISVGRNRYNLPSPETLARLEDCGAAVWRTDENGNLEIGR